MNADKEKSLVELARRNPYWVCLAVFLALAGDQGFRLGTQVEQRNQLDQARLMHAQNLSALIEAQQLESRLQFLSLELLQVARTNDVAKRIVQEFNIQWNPTPGAAQPASEATPGAAPPAATAPPAVPPAAVPAATVPPAANNPK